MPLNANQAPVSIDNVPGDGDGHSSRPAPGLKVDHERRRTVSNGLLAVVGLSLSGNAARQGYFQKNLRYRTFGFRGVVG